MKKIALLITGGTIAMQTNAGESEIPDSPLDYKELHNLTPADVNITSHVLCYKDSSSIGVDIWQLIIEKINSLASEYDGFIVSHGTDTMAYSAAAVAYHFGKHLPCPIVFTGSCRSPDLPNTDAWINLKAAVKVACSQVGEVVVVFAGKVWRAVRIIKIAPKTATEIYTKIPAKINTKTSSKIPTKTSTMDDAIFSTPQVQPVAEIVGDDLVINSHCRLLVPTEERENNSVKFRQPIRFSDKMLFINSMPAIDSSSLRVLAQVPSWKLCLIQGMGAGNLTDDVIDFVEESLQNKKHIVLMPLPFSPVTSIYPPLKKSLALGAILTEGYSICSLWVKLSWLLGKAEQQSTDINYQEPNYQEERDLLKQELNTDFVGEIVLLS